MKSEGVTKIVSNGERWKENEKKRHTEQKTEQENIDNYHTKLSP